METCNSTIITLLNKYSISNTDGTLLQEFITRILDSEPVIPVLGMQGMGKSTLINAVLEENILPNEADETTCVPVEIKYGVDEYAEVMFADSSEIVKVNTIGELREFVDNNYNPANEKGVLKIVLYRNRDILKSGVVLVDLPGVGSMTLNNEATTMKYLQNLCTAIFVIPTVPTIRKQEAMFIKAIWSQFSNAIFVQNDWGESKQEIDESVDFNSKLLKGIAKELNASFDSGILVVNAFNALAGALRKDENLRRMSNVDALSDRIRELSTHWKLLQEESAKDRIRLMVDASILFANNLIVESNRSREEVIKKREQELADLQCDESRLEEKIQEVNNFLDDKKREFNSFVQSSASDCIKKIRVSMNKTIDSGVYDGDALTTVFNDEQGEKVAEYLEIILDKQLAIKQEVDEKLDDLSKIEFEHNDEVATEGVHKKHAFRYEKGVDFLCKLGGAAAGVAVGAKVGAAVGTAIVPGVGTAVGFVVGAVIGVAGSFIGSLFKSGVSAKRASQTKRELEPLYKKIESTIVSHVTREYACYSDSLIKSLNVLMEVKHDQECYMKQHLHDFNETIDVDEINKDLLVLTNYKESL